MSAQTRDFGLSLLVTKALEIVGVLNKGSSKPAEETSPISSNALNVTRVGGTAALITALGAPTFAIFQIDRKEDSDLLVAVAFASTAIIIAAALIMVAVIMAADIRGRSRVSEAGASAEAAAGNALAFSVFKRPKNGTAIRVDRPYGHLMVDTATSDDESGDVTLELPKAEDFPDRCMVITRAPTDRSDVVTVWLNQEGTSQVGLTSLQPRLEVYSRDTEWKELSRMAVAPPAPPAGTGSAAGRASRQRQKTTTP